MAIVVLVVAAASYYYQTHRPATAAVSGICDESLWAHVYHPARLHDPDPNQHHHCMTVTGVVAAVVKEADGDDHIRLQLDVGQPAIINDKNRSDQGGNLVVEPMCVGAVTQEDAKAACASYTNQVAIPHAGDHVTVVGVYSFDSEHGWMEIHPVTSINIG